MTKDEFINRLWITYKARFNAHSRLLKQEMLYTVITSFLSFFVIALNILQIIPDVIIINQSATTFYTIIVSLFILIISLINNSSTRKHNAEQFHQCALEIKGLYEKLSVILNDIINEDYSSFIQDYNSIESRYNINHSKSDYQQVLIERDKKTFIEKIPFSMKNYFVNYFFPSLLLLIPIIFGLLIIF
jgi:hypothetical protein